MTISDTRPQDVLAQFARTQVVPVVVVEDARTAAPLGRALLAGGLPIAEVTFRTPAARDAIRAMAEIDEMLVGAGTVLRAEQVEDAVNAGARFIVSPGFSAAVVDAARAYDLPVLTGASTATEIQMALEHGQDVVKLFPVEAAGGLATLKALAAPFPAVRFVPTGGITAANAPAYLAHPAVLAVGGTWMVAPELVARGDFGEVSRRASAAVDLARSIRAEKESSA